MSPGDIDRIVGKLDVLTEEVAELRTSITGNRVMGHKGIVERLEHVEQLHAEVPEVHHGIEERAKRGRSELHERVDELRAEWNRAKYVAMGIAAGLSIVGGGVGTWVYNLLSAT